ncbi:MAG TPA: zinc ribbon domain-containing protein [Geobacteraceae bacterium]|jgi:putative FmdB family regulatory protein|nr:zinc ribbon domain-containing protein [Geobacteraceae bacterium]
MPLYEYRCSDCGQEFELRQKFSDEPATVCPACGGSIEKLISRTSFSLKGSGWYNEGYSKDSRPKTPQVCPKEGSCASCPSASA